jgi:hypothetical protein
LKHLEVFHTFSEFLPGTLSILAVACLSSRLSRPRRGKQDRRGYREHLHLSFC